MKKELNALVTELIPFGEDEKELRFWEDIFDDLTEENKRNVLENLRKELALLKKI